MAWFRRGVVQLLSLLLLVSLIACALATSAKLNLSNPNKLESWLNQSNFYNGLVDSALMRAQQSAANSSTTTISYTDDAVQQAAHSALSPELVSQDVNTFLDSNYAWLKGKTSTPSFTINLSSAKQSFAEQVAQAAQTRLNSLPVCTAAQQAQIQDVGSVDPLTIDCRPSFIDPATEASDLKNALSDSNDFLANPTLTANTPTPNTSSQGKPYYQQFSRLPKLYRLAMDLSWTAAVVAVISGAGLLLAAASRRKGWWHIGWMLLLAGAALIATKFFSDAVFKDLENHVFNNASIGQLQQALTSFFGIMERNLVRVDLWFGIAYAAVAALLFVGLIATKGRARPATNSAGFNRHGPAKSPSANTSETSRPPAPGLPGRNVAPPRTPPAQPGPPKPPRPPRPPRLIQ